MLYAKDARGNFVQAKKAGKHKQYFCPGCLRPVILKKGELKVAHFAHQKKSCLTFSEGETLEHLKGKELLVRWCAQMNFHVELEAYQKKLKQRPDVLCSSNFQSLALEFQCAPLTVQQMVTRSAGYKRNGFKYIWFLGRRHYPSKKMTQQIAQFIRWHRNMGFYLIYIDTVYQRFEVLYGIQMGDLLPLKFMRFFAHSFSELVNFMHTDHQVRYFSITGIEKNQQIQNLIYRVHSCDRQFYQAQKCCYQQGFSFMHLAELMISDLYYPPIYRHFAFSWKIFAVLNKDEQMRKIDVEQLSLRFINQHNLFYLPFVDLTKFRLREWHNFLLLSAKIDFDSKYRYN